MQVSTYEKQPSKSITLPKGQLTEKKIFFTSSQCKRHLNGKLSSRYLPSGFKSKVLQHSQERESDVFFTSCSQRNARDIGNFKQGYRKQKKIQTIDWATKPGGQSLMDLDNTSHKCSGYQMRMENRRQPHATVESKKKKIQTEKDMLRNHHHDTDRILSNIWYIVLWREMKKQAKKIADFKADADSSSYKAMSDEKQMIFHKSPKKSIQTHPTKRPSNSTRNKHEENFESEENLIFASSEGVKILSWDTVSYSKKVPATYVLSNLSSPKQLKDTAADKRPFDLLGTKRPSDSTGNNLEKLFVSNEDLAFRSSKGVEVNNESQKRYVSHKFESSFQATMNQKFVYKYPPTPPVSSNASILNQNRNNEEIEVTSLQLELQEAKESVAYRISLADIYLSDITGEKSKEDRDATRLTPEDTLSTLSDNWVSIQTEDMTSRSDTTFNMFPKYKNQNMNLAFITLESQIIDRVKEIKIYVLPEEVRRKFINLSKSIHSEDSLDYVSLLPDIALSDKTGKKSKTRYKEEWYIARKNKYELKEKVVGNRQGNGKHLVTSAKLHTPSTQDQIQDQGREATRWIFEQILSVLLYWRQRSNRASEDSADQPTHHTDTSSDDHHTTFNSQDEDNTIMPGK
ncbi:hypothetical protein ACJMK2_029113 [Sinanodonta woodiana]|uniref:Uncharacterized protein n=2 Tax=Sinanodonta woodiana TaxID=1069815 RepID=A0ABD3X9P7_SINWO